MTRAYTITTAISYPNGPPHIGHAYELIAADAIARFRRLQGRDVYFQTGTDHHGQKMVRTAAQLGVPVRALGDRNADLFEAMVQALDCAPDRFIRTVEPAHYAASQALWQRMADAGAIYLGRYDGWYSVRDEAYYTEDETTVAADGTRLGPQGTPVEWQEEESYFFRLSAFQDRLLQHYEANPRFIQPESRRNEVLSFVRGGLADLSISRTAFDWGVPVPGDPRHVMYVWVDALTNYITGLGFPDTDDPRWARWPADVHIIGKDIVRFHAVYWPAFLMAAGLPPPRAVFGHGFLFNRGEKMSKSVGNVVDPFGMAEHYGVDAVRYFFLREVAFGQDGSYSHEAIVQRLNADLANDLGNLAQRSLSMVAKAGAVVPAPGALQAEDEAMLAAADRLGPALDDQIEAFALHAMLADIFAVVGACNRYVTAAEPWKLAKTDPARRDTVLYVTLEVLRQVGIPLQAFMPRAAGKLLDALGVAAGARSLAALGPAGRLSPGTPLPPPAPLFPRYVPAEERA